MDDEIPVYLTPMVRAWACRKRGLCCKHQMVQVDEVERRRLEKRLGEIGDPVAAELRSDRLRREGGWAVLPQREERCVFLGEDALCTIRTRFGDALYPRVCKKFPYLSILTPDRQLVGLSFQCPTALQLLAEETSFEVLVERGVEPPVQSVAWMGDAERECRDLGGNPIGIEAFWVQHEMLFERFRSRPELDPTERLVAFAAEITGQDASDPVEMTRLQWRHGAFDESIAAELERLSGEAPPGLPSLWTHSTPEPYTLDALPEPDERELLMRYLLHRFLVPVFYLSHADPLFLLVTMLAMLARYRIERERGYDVLGAVRQLDRFFVHTGNAAALYRARSTPRAWRAMASLASARTID